MNQFSKKKNRFFTLLLMIVFAFSLFALAGCDFDMSGSSSSGGSQTGGGGSSGSGGGGSGSGGSGSGGSDAGGDGGSSGGMSNLENYGTKQYDFKAGFRPESASQSSKQEISDFADILTTSFATTFGAGGLDDVTPIIAGFKNQENDYSNILFYDSIRYEPAVVNENSYQANADASWKWTFGYKHNLCDSYLKYSVSIERYEAEDDLGVVYYYTTQYVDYIELYSTLYSDLMEIVLLKIGSGETRNLSSLINITCESDQLPVIRIGGETVPTNEDGIPDYSDFISEAQLEYDRLGDYYGFTSSDADIIEDFILSTVIGSAATADDMTTNRHYQDYVSSLMHEYIKKDGAQFRTYARTNVFDTRGFKPNWSTSNPFESIEALEYQSLIIMPNETLSIAGYWLGFESTRDMTIAMYIRSYDDQTNNITTSSRIRFSVKKGTFDFATNDNSTEDVLLKHYFSLEPFDNNEDVKAVDVEESTKTLDIYKLDDALSSDTIMTTFNETYATSSFLEVVFRVEKSASDPEDADYTFKLAVIGVNVES